MSGVVVIGTGFGCVSHVRALRAAGFDVMALVGRDRAKTAERAALFEIPTALTSVEEALAVDGVDAVTVATPPHTHADIALVAIAAGKHLICEKPFARDAAEGRKVLAAAEEAGVVHLLGCEFRWDGGQAGLARAVSDGAVGEPRLVTVLLHVPLLADRSAEVPVWWADTSQGGGWLGAHGSQVIDQLRVTLGEFESVSASLPHVAERDMSAEDGFVVHFRMRSGAVGTLQSTSGDWGPPIVITRVTGSTGTAWIEGVGSTVKVADAAGTRTLPVPEDLPAAAAPPLPEGLVHTTYDRMISHGMDFGPYTRLAEVLRCRMEGRPPPPGPRAATFADGVLDMAVVDAVRRSAAERAWVTVEGLDEPAGHPRSAVSSTRPCG
jgi:predicted dehydrogenase